MDFHALRTSRARVRSAVAVAAVVVLTLAAAGCGDDDEETSTGQESGGGGGEEMSAEIVSPADGDTVGAPVDLELDSSEDVGEPDTGLHHFHVFVDGDDVEYEIAYEESHTIERDLSDGEHTIEVALANPDHSLVDGATRDEITVTVGEGGGAGSGGTTETSTDTGETTETTGGSDGGYDY
jgi:hypothetical protein